MTARKRLTASDLKRIDDHVIAPEEYDDSPELTADQLEKAVVSRGGVPVKRERKRS